jgi:hypothetical protein
MLRGGRTISCFLSTKLNVEKIKKWKGGSQMRGLRRTNVGGGEKGEEGSNDA